MWIPTGGVGGSRERLDDRYDRPGEGDVCVDKKGKERDA